MSEHRSDGRRRSDEALRQSEDRYRRLVDLSPDAVFIIQAGRVILVNPAGVRLVGVRDASEVVGRPVVDLIHADDQRTVLARIDEVLTGDRPTVFQERRYTRFDGKAVDVEVASTLYPDPAGPAIQVILRDITERKRAEATSHESEERFRQIAETIDEVFWITPPDKNRMIYVSPAYEKIWGRACADLYVNPRNWLAAIHPDDRDRVIHAALTKQSEGTYDEEYRILRPDGAERWIRDRAFPLRRESGEIHRLVGLAEDITDRKHVESEIRALSEQLEGRVVERTVQLKDANEALRKADSRQRALLNAIPDVVFRIHRDGTFLDFSASRGKTFLPPDQIIGTNLMAAAIPAEVRVALKSAIDRAIDAGTVVPLEYALPADGVTRHYEARIVRSGPDEVVATIRDITQRKNAEAHRERLEQQLRQSQKMEAIGTLAGGIAHDFNNILTAILGYAELLRAQVRGQAGVEERLTEITKAGSRAKDLVAQILTFSRRQEHSRTTLSLGPAIDDALKLMRAAIPTSIEIDAHVDSDLPPVLADATQIHQVVMNLAANAAAAMAGGPGRLVVRCSAVLLDAAGAADAGLSPGRFVRLVIEDTGCGMPPDVLERIFDPFFTTKGPGEGTGLGLSVVHGIVKAHDGTITVDSRVGEGTVFRIYFPALLERQPTRAGQRPTAVSGQGEHVLCVDDEPALVELLRDQLQTLGYRVTAYVSPLEALSDFLARPLDFDVVLTDLTMPGMSGADLAERILKVRPDLPIVMATGYGHVMTEERVRELGVRPLLYKPFSMSVLADAIQDALAATRAESGGTS
jgi:PAS domain S-box-containing protein